MMIMGKDCAGCKYYQRIDKLHVKCWIKNKQYIWGQSVPDCENQVEGLQEHQDIYKEN